MARKRSPTRGGRVAILAIAATLACLAGAPTALAADTVYWANRLGNTISFANLDGSGGGNLTTTGTTVSGPFGTALDAVAGRIYWANIVTNKISFAKLDGTGGGDVSTGSATVNQPAGVAVDRAAGRIYWANVNTTVNKISFAKLDGSGGGDINTTGATVSGPFGVAIDSAAGRIYWANSASTKISFAKLDGTGGADLNTTGATVNQPVGVAVDTTAGRIYWANFAGNKISFARLDGTGGGDLNTTGATVSGPEGVAVDAAAGRIYWGNAIGNKISFAKLDGTGGGDLTTTGAMTSFSVFPSLLLKPAGTGAPKITGGPGLGSQLSCSRGSWAPDLESQFFYRAPASFAYQWSRNGTDITGATASSLTASTTGAYRCRVQATNHAGSATQTSAALTVIKTRAPNTRITKAKIRARRHRATFRFKAIGKATGFQCRLRRDHKTAKFRRCHSPKTYQRLKRGRYTFAVRAVGPGGRDPSPAKRRFRIR